MRWTTRSHSGTARAERRFASWAGAALALLVVLVTDAAGEPGASGPGRSGAPPDSGPASLRGTAEIEPSAGAPLVIQGDTVHTFRARLAGILPPRRAEIAQERVGALMFAQLLKPVRLEPLTGGYAVLVGDVYVFIAADDDADPAGNLSAAQAAEQSRERLARALSARARLLSPSHRGLALLWTVLATIALAALLRALAWARKRGLAWFATRTESHRAKMRVGDVDFLDYLSRILVWFARLLVQVSGFVLVVFWIVFVLARFPETQPWAEAARVSILGMVRTVEQQVLRAIPSVIAIALIVVGGRFATRLANDLFHAIERGTVRIPAVHPETAQATRRLVVALIWVTAVVIAYPLVPGSGSDAFKGVSVLIGLMVTLGSSGIVGHLMSGLVLVYSRALRKGDVVRVNDLEGIVTEVGPLSVKLANVRKEEFTIPNSVIVGTTVKNYTRMAAGSGAALSTTVTIGYDAPWRVVYEMLLGAAERTEGIRSEPAPVVYQASLSDFYVEYQLVVAVEVGTNRVSVLSRLHENIQDAFNERGVQIMSPHFEGQPERTVVVPRAKWNRAPGDSEG